MRTRHSRRQIKRLRHVDNHTNLLYLAAEYITLVVVICGAVGFAEYRAVWGFAWAWNIPVFVTAIILVGGLQHRLAGLGHESSHYSFMRNRSLNDLVLTFSACFPYYRRSISIGCFIWGITSSK